MVYMSPFLKNHLNIPGMQKQNIGATNTIAGNHDEIYNDLTRHANDVRPNEAKAKLVKENFATSIDSSLKDVKQDIVNLNTAVKTGKMNDTRLGRINDLGMKLGAGAIATFLALHSKSKTEAIMKFIGGGAFIASMSLWPKLFINAPAKAIHGFDIGQKYISAQGDKKDFFLDNQFLPWDAYSKEEMDEIGKKTGIDPNSKNGHEKIQRKMQKTALQNRTLWMATAGFATPIMSALISNRLEPVVKAVVTDVGATRAIGTFDESLVKVKENGVEKEVSRLTRVLDSVKKDVRNQEDVERLVNVYKGKEPDKYFYEEITKYFSLNDVYAELFNPDDAKTFEKNNQEAVERTLKKFYEQCNSDKINPDKVKAFVENLESTNVSNVALNTSKKLQNDEIQKILSSITEASSKKEVVAILNKNGVEKDNIKEIVSQIFENNKLKYEPKEIETVIKNAVGFVPEKLSKEVVEEITKQIIDNPTLENFTEVFKQHKITSVSAEAFNLLFDKDYDKFYQTIVDFNKTDLAAARPRLKKYVKSLNPLVGSKEEALSTKYYNMSMKRLFGELALNSEEPNIIIKTLQKDEIPRNSKWFKRLCDFFSVSTKKAKELSQAENKDIINELSDFFRKNSTGDYRSYIKFIKKIAGKSFAQDEYEAIQTAMKTESISQIAPKTTLGSLTDAIFGKKTLDHWYEENVDSPLQHKNPKDIGFNHGSVYQGIQQSIENKIAEVETAKLRTILCANFERRLSMKEFADWTSEDIKAAKNMIYDSSISLRMNGGYAINTTFQDGAILDRLAPRLFDSSKFKTEKYMFPEIEKFVDELKAVKFTNKSAEHAALRNSKKYIISGGLTDAVKRHATSVYNNKIWLKTFGIIGAGLAAATLLAQFAFGKIDKEYPEEKQGGVK